MVKIEFIVEQMMKQYILRDLHRPIKFIKLDKYYCSSHKQFLCSDIELEDNNLIFQLYPIEDFFQFTDNQRIDLTEKYCLPPICTAYTLYCFLDELIDRTKRSSIDKWFEKESKYVLGDNTDYIYNCKNDYRNKMMTFYIRGDKNDE